ncbi:hydroxymethylbilane synthase [Vallitalea okinawensis]|uniref:hydroxymethylbilane synthase n=1 Tax=Vallitalea okinawensis TaxID=2078660 RepID=UPI001A9A3078|nr:hydroxymethylbilane synthase [Vallitalea okinawensis]
MEKVIIGTRGSLLAVKQTNLVKKMLEEVHPQLSFEIKTIVTTGDQHQKVPMIGDSGSLKIDFVKEIERELLAGNIHLAVHSMKDMPLVSHEELVIGAIPKREDNRDVLISGGNIPLYDFKAGAVIGTSSLRRQESILHVRPDLKVKPIRGNIDTRIKKMEAGDYDGIVLAAAGLKRAGLEERITCYFTYDEMLPAPTQGILAIQCRRDDESTLKILSAINDPETAIMAKVEKKFAKLFDAGCHTPMGCTTSFEGDQMTIQGMYVYEGNLYRGTAEGSISKPEILADRLAEDIWRKING